MGLMNSITEASFFAGTCMTQPEFFGAIKEHMDYSDRETLATVAAIDEADRTAVVTSLTSNLYDTIVSKADDIDFGSIASSKGDMTKVENYEEFLNTIQVLRDLLKEYHEDTDPVDQVSMAIENIRKRTDTWKKGYQMNLGLIIMTYETMTLACISSISLLIATSIEFIKSTGTDTFNIALDKVAYKKTSANLLYNNLKKFNSACKDGTLDTALGHIVETNMKKLTGSSVALAAVGFLLVLNILLPMLRELVFFFYNAKQSVSDYFAIQADLLNVNATNLQYKSNTTISDEERNSIFSKQTSIANGFKKISDVFAVKMKKSENDAAKTISSDNRKYKISDLTNGEKLDSAPLLI